MQHYYGLVWGVGTRLGLQAHADLSFLHVGLGMMLPLYYIFFMVFTISKHAEYRAKGIYKPYAGAWLQG